jgi:group II intron reverse transcriptase/maturase
MKYAAARYRRTTSGASSPQAALADLQAQIFGETREVPRPILQLMTWLLDRRNLEAAWDRVRNAEGANTPGVDGVTCNEVRGRAVPWLTRLADDLYHRRYRPAAPRWVEVPKPGHPAATRRLGILTIRDRVVHAAVKQVLEPLLEPGFWPFSFGFRPGRSVPGALAEALRLLAPPAGQDTPPYAFAVHVDVAHCFDTVDHELLTAELTKHVADPALLHLVGQILRPGGVTVRRLFRRRTQGLVQGSGLSPLLCNLYLHPLDQGLRELERSSQNAIRALRYADDLLLLARDRPLADRAVACTSRLLTRRRQRLRNPGVAPCLVHDGVDWLGVRLQARARRWSKQVAFGYVVPDAKVADMLDRLTEMTMTPSDKIDASAFNPEGWVVSLNEQLRDWHQAYQFADNAVEVFRALDQHTRERLGLLLQTLTNARRHEVAQRHHVRLPRGFWTWEVNGVRLVALSSLAPRCPTGLTRRPAWMRQAPRPPATPGGSDSRSGLPAAAGGSAAPPQTLEQEDASCAAPLPFPPPSPT